ncbi:exodeoxyribonuclease V subunit alpha [Mycobacterium sp. MS1601]|nr:exodeoxyribonuclease V subunit alpha [Mycobacterium sp. MS1601]
MYDWRRVNGARGLLHEFNNAGVLEAADVHVAMRLTQLAGETDETVALAAALAVRGLRYGSVCVDLSTVAADTEVDVPWPEISAWLSAVRASPLLGTPPVLRLFGDHLLYLDRYFREEEQVCADLLATRGQKVPVDAAALTAGLDRVFPAQKFPEQRAAAQIALSQWTTVLTGGPGTGKTTTVAGLLALLAEQAELTGRTRPRIALAAPTGKASARLQQAVQTQIDHLEPQDRARLSGLHAVTLHRLLGRSRKNSGRFEHNRSNRLPYDVIVVDETSMVPLTMMARLLESIRPATRLILVGDPDQLASVEAGAVLADLVDGLGARGDLQVAALHTSHRFGESIGALADAVRRGDGDEVLSVLRSGNEHIEYLEEPSTQLRDVLVGHALDVRAAALRGESQAALSALDSHRLLCAHRDGPHGVRHWNRQIERWLSEETGEGRWADWYAGRPVLVTENDYGLRLYNGDTGVTVRDGDHLRVVIGGAAGMADFSTSRLADVETMHAMTIHKSQGSQADEVTVLLPPEDSRLLTRELFYTAITRAKMRVRVVGTEAGVRAALDRRVVRATGLRQRLAD